MKLEMLNKAAVARTLPVLAACALLFTTLAPPVEAQTYSVLHRFDGTDGLGAGGHLLCAGATLYGTTRPGTGSSPALGAMFTLRTNGSAFSSFRLNDGADPEAGLVLSGTKLYGTARATYSNPYGTVFALNTEGTGYTVLKNFNQYDGAYPMADLALVGSTLYGTTYQGGASGDGTVFKVNTDGSGFMLMRAFSGGDGIGPVSSLVVSGDSLFGTTMGGSSFYGSIYRIQTNSTWFMVLKRFNGVEGAYPQGLLLSGVTIYGVTSQGGTFNRGTLFRMNTDGTGFAVLKNFSGPDGDYPVGSLVQFDNTLYGVTYYGGSSWVEGGSTGYGTIFRMEPDGSGFYVLHSFTPPDGANPTTYAGLAVDGYALYGTTQFGGTPNYGTLFSFTLPRAPWIILPPSNQVAAVGSTVSFSATSLGGRPMHYQWLFDGTNFLRDMTNSTLQLPSVSFPDAGTYSVVVTNMYGSATSSPAQLRIVQASIVTNCTEADLRAAMATGGAVSIACDGTFNLDNTLEIATSTALDASGRQVTISGGDRVQVFRVHTNVTLSLASLTVANGCSTNGAGGGGIQLEGGTLNLQRVTFLSNVATNPASVPTNIGCGGAILNQRGTLNATNCAFVHNAAENGPVPMYLGSNGVAATLGGAICNEEGSAFLEDCTFISNRVVAASWQGFPPNTGLSGLAARGGALYSSGSLFANQCAFVANSVTGGRGGKGTPSDFLSQQQGVPGGEGGPGEGGAVSSLGSLKIWSSLFFTNTAFGGKGGDGGDGYGGQWAWGSWGSAGGTGGAARAGGLFSINTAELVNCTFASNQAVGGEGGNGGGGGWGINQGTGQTVYWGGGPGGNGGAGDGSAVFSTNGVAGITNCTVAFNLGTGGAGAQGGSGQPPGGPGANGTASAALRNAGGDLVNTLIATNTPANLSGTIIDRGHNLSSDSTDLFTNSTSLRNADPGLVALADNGGPTLTMALKAGSPAIDAGQTASAPATDQRVLPRPVGAAADIGAFEYGSPAFLQVFRAVDSGVDILASGVRGQMCTWLTSTNLGSWIPLATNQFGPQGTILFHAPALDERRYFRLLLPP